MKILVGFFFLLSAMGLYAQNVPQPAPVKPLTLPERYYQMKTSAETYSDYKVIKEYVLDRTWKVSMDSLGDARSTISKNNEEIRRLNHEKELTAKELGLKQLQITDLDHAGTHISFLGIDFGKKTFVVMSVLIFAGLMVLAGFLAMQINLIRSSSREKSERLDAISKEFDEYKHHALEKQAKISRELQNARNRLVELHKAG